MVILRNKKTACLIALIIICNIFLVMFTGCIEEEQTLIEPPISPLVEPDIPSILPDWQDGEYHDYYAATQMLNDFNEKYPSLTNVFSIGKSVLGKDIQCIKITNEKNNNEKFTCLIDGCIHGEEWEAGEACLYLAEYLLINFETNKTITEILNVTEVYIIPILNPDGRQKSIHENDNSVDLNRNFDIFFGKLRGRCLRLGKLFGRIKIPVIKIPFLDPYVGWFRNCGRYAFSEPESKALRDLLISINNDKFSFYVNCHTATHEIVAPWDTYKPPFPMKTQHEQVLKYVGNWVEKNTEYSYSMNSALKIGGEAMDWVYKEFQKPSFIFEMLSMDYDALYAENKHDHLVHWMKTTLPFFMYLLVNVENLHNWQTPDVQPLLPDGIPPDPLK